MSCVESLECASNNAVELRCRAYTGNVPHVCCVQPHSGLLDVARRTYTETVDDIAGTCGGAHSRCPETSACCPEVDG